MTRPEIHSSLKHIVGLMSLLIVFATSVSRAQISEYTFKSLTVDHGLSQYSVYAILQDRRGFMWFGTNDGLNRYDGILGLYTLVLPVANKW